MVAVGLVMRVAAPLGADGRTQVNFADPWLAPRCQWRQRPGQLPVGAGRVESRPVGLRNDNQDPEHVV